VGFSSASDGCCVRSGPASKHLGRAGSRTVGQGGFSSPLVRADDAVRRLPVRPSAVVLISRTWMNRALHETNYLVMMIMMMMMTMTTSTVNND